MDQQTALRLQSNGHTVHLKRGTYTHEALNRHPSQEAEVTNDGTAIPIPRLGRNLKVRDCLPEWVALALDHEGKILSPTEFNQNYKAYIAEYGIIGSPAYEPVPSPVDLLLTTVDPLTGRMNARLDSPADDHEPKEPEKLWHPDGIPYDEWKAKQEAQSAPAADSRSIKAEQLMALHADGTISKSSLDAKLAELFGGVAIQVKKVDEAQEPAPAPEMISAPCGKEVKARGLRMHYRHCKQPECVAAKAHTQEEAE